MNGAPGDTAAVLGGLFLAAWAGAVLLGALDPRGMQRATWPVRWALGFCSGTGLVALALFVLGLARQPFAATPVLVLLPALALVAALISARRAGAQDPRDRGPARIVRALVAPFARTQAPAPSPTGAAPAVEDTLTTRPLRSAPATRAVRLVLLALTLGCVAMIARSSLGYGAQFADAHGLWMLKARVFATDGGFDGAYFEDWSDGHERRAYPVLLPLAGTWMHLLGGQVDDTLVKWLYIGFLLALLALVHALLAARLPPWLAAAGLLAFVLSRQTVLTTVWGVADLPLACLLLAALHALLESAARRSDTRATRSALVRAAWFLALAAFTKSEGMVAAPVVAGAWWLVGRRAVPRARPWTAALLVLPAALLVAAWLSVPARHGIALPLGPGVGVPSASDLLDRLATLGRAVLPLLISPAWLYVWPLALLVALRPTWRARVADRSLLLLVPSGLLLAASCVYLLQGGDLPWLLSTTLDRLMYHGYPAVFVWVLLALGTGPSAVGAPAHAGAVSDRQT